MAAEAYKQSVELLKSQPSSRSSNMERPSFFIDFEASGIAPDSYPIEVAVVSSETSLSSLIKPVRY